MVLPAIPSSAVSCTLGRLDSAVSHLLMASKTFVYAVFQVVQSHEPSSANLGEIY